MAKLYLPNGEELGWLHPIYGLWTRTGRSSAKSEEGGSLHQMPREPWMRGMITAPPSCKLVVCDNSMIELRVLAWLAHEEHMLELFKEEADLHRATAAYVSIALPKYNMPMAEFWPRREEFMPLVTKEQRSRAKPVNFGLAYGQQPLGFVDYARTSYGIQYTLEQAVLAHEGFFKMYPGLLAFFEEARRWYKRGWAITPLGRMRHHFSTVPEAINFPVQSVASDLLFLAMVALDKEIKERQMKAAIFAEVHDSLLIYAKENVADEVGTMAVKHMERPQTELLGLDFNDISVPLRADLHILNVWVEECAQCKSTEGSTYYRRKTDKGLDFVCEECYGSNPL